MVRFGGRVWTCEPVGEGSLAEFASIKKVRVPPGLCLYSFELKGKIDCNILLTSRTG